MTQLANQNYWAELDWSKMGLELDYRAKIYSMLGAASPESSSEGVVLFEVLQRLVNQASEKPRAGEWEWIFEPLIYKLLAKHALWVCLGHFTGDRKNPKRRWLYFLSKDLSYNYSLPGEENSKGLASFARALRHFSFNASYADLAEKTILVTSKLLELFFPEGPHIDLSYPYGAPFETALQSEPIDWDSENDSRLRKRIFAVDWRDLYENAAKVKDRHDILRVATDDSKIAELLKPPDSPDKASLIGFCWKEPADDHASLSSAQAYAEALQNTFSQDFRLNSKHFDPSHDEKYFQKLLQEDPDAHHKIAQYVAWIQDIADESSQVITIPAWLPGEGSTGRSGSIIVCTQLGMELSAVDITGLIPAFRLGCVNVPVEATRKLSQKGALHHIPKIFSSAIDELVKFQSEHNRRNCRQPFEIPAGFILAIGSLYELSKDITFRPRWPWIEKELCQEGITENVINYLFDQVATKLGPHKLIAENKFPKINDYPKCGVSGSWGCPIRTEEATYLPALLATLMTEAWEHTTRLALDRKPDQSFEIKVTIKTDHIVLDNPCSKDTVYRPGSNQIWDINQLLKYLPMWEVSDPPPDSIKKGRWIRKLWRKAKMSKQPRSLDILQIDSTSLWITWVDDAFDNDSLGNTFRLPFNFVEAYLKDPSGYTVDSTDLKVLKVAKEICETHRIGFRIANFEYLENRPQGSLPPNEYYLVDSHYGGQDSEDYYGIRLVTGMKLSTDRFRILSGVPQAQIEVQVYYSKEQAISKRPELFPKDFEAWLDSLLLHEDPIVCRALSFYARPWVESGYPGKWHEGPEPNHSSRQYPQALAEWINLANEEVDIDSSKSLLIWRPEKGFWGDWYLNQMPSPNAQREGYPLLGNVLAAVMKRLELRAEGIDEKSKYRMPLDPSLPFLLCLRVFACSVNDNPRVIWKRFESGSDVVTYHVAISCEEVSWGLRNRYYDRGGRGQGNADPLDFLMESKLQLKSEAADWKKLFTGGVEQPPCGVSFTPGWVHLFWTSRR